MPQPPGVATALLLLGPMACALSWQTLAQTPAACRFLLEAREHCALCQQMPLSRHRSRLCVASFSKHENTLDTVHLGAGFGAAKASSRYCPLFTSPNLSGSVPHSLGMRYHGGFTLCTHPGVAGAISHPFTFADIHTTRSLLATIHHVMGRNAGTNVAGLSYGEDSSAGRAAAKRQVRVGQVS